jgi:hypothetical protein
VLRHPAPVHDPHPEVVDDVLLADEPELARD